MAIQTPAAGTRNDRDLEDPEPTPAQSGSSGGTLATDIGSEDEENMASGGDPQPTGPTKADKVQPRIPTRSDHEGANR